MSSRSLALWALAGGAIALLFLTGHGPHVIGFLPFVALLACPLMHMLMHRQGHPREP